MCCYYVCYDNVIVIMCISCIVMTTSMIAMLSLLLLTSASVLSAIGDERQEVQGPVRHLPVRQRVAGEERDVPGVRDGIGTPDPYPRNLVNCCF